MINNREHIILSNLLDVNKEISKLTDIKTLVSIIIEKSPRIVDAERASIFLLDPQTNELWTLVAMGLSEGQEIRLETSSGIVGHVFTTRKILNITDAYADERFNPEIDKQFNFKTRNILCAPIFNKDGNPIGVIEIMNKKHGNFSKNDEEIIQLFCEQVAVSIENVLLYEELKVSYDALKRAQDQLIRAEKLAVVGQVAAGIAHEIKNQMVGFTFAELLKAEYPEDERVQEYTETIIETKEHILSIVNELRDFAQNRQITYPKDKHTLADVVKSVISFIKFDPDIKSHKLSTNYTKNPMVFINTDKIRQLLINIIRNAAHAIGTERRGQIEINVTATQDWAIIQVTDNGSGIPESRLDKIWQPFYTTKGEIIGGLGLGLDICRRIVEGHGGQITCQSVVDQGTTFLIQLPLLTNPKTLDSI